MNIQSKEVLAGVDLQLVTDELGTRLRRLTANLLRVSIGGGKPCAIETQVRDLCAIFDAYRGLTAQSMPGDTLAPELDLLELRSRHRPWLDDGVTASAPEKATIMIVGGALEVTASRLLNQRAPEARGRRRMDDGIRELQRQQLKGV